MDLTDVYTDRNRVIMLMANMAKQLGYKVEWGIDRTLEDPLKWPVLYIQLPTGQISWHINRDDIVVNNFPTGGPQWDGHSDLDKNRRIENYMLMIPVYDMIDP